MAAPASMALSISYTFLAGPPVAVVEPLTIAIYLEQDSDIGRYETAFNHLRSEALDADASRRYIHDLIKD
ncbi:Scr1 family TA system antitoxin-like transcriptional regulator [Streptomyces paludis]|uniref:Scr1 family TA system antitoxin-like transcriptional regulator n=1 Tax=Streptomyces paludis TaxID=2282738 RepID=UPI0022B1B6C4|nr:Scr1 family TA system antitoxin-like transcriptional regulator [Streptomyces paludis]